MANVSHETILLNKKADIHINKIIIVKDGFGIRLCCFDMFHMKHLYTNSISGFLFLIWFSV